MFGFAFAAFLIFGIALFAAGYYIWTVPQQEEQRVLAGRMRELRAHMRGRNRSAPELLRREHRGTFAFLGDLVTWIGVLRRLQDIIEQANLKYRAADEGKKINNYAFGLVPAEFFGLVKNAPGTPSIAELKRKAKAGFVLAQLTPQGWTNVSGQLIAYSQGTASAAGFSCAGC